MKISFDQLSPDVRNLRSNTQTQLLQNKNFQFFSNNDHGKKGPKKFANLKTMNEMKGFIEAMDKAELSEKEKLFQKQPSKKSQISSLKFSLIEPKSSQKEKNKVQQLTNRLYYQSERRKTTVTDACCKRKQCQQNIPTIQRHETQNFRQFTGQPLRQHPVIYKGHFHRSLEMSLSKLDDSSFSTRSKQKENVHMRLFEDSIARQVRNYQQRKSIEESFINLANSLQSSRVQSKAASQYAKNYQSFYSRLQDLVEFQKNKHKIFDKLKYSSSGQLVFKSTRSHSSDSSVCQSPEQQARKMVILSTTNTKCSKIKCHSKQQQIERQLNRSRQKLDLNKKSVEIIQSHEKKILQQIKGLFFNKKTGVIRVKEGKVSQLSSFEFDVWFKLIIEIEASSDRIKSEKMLEKLILNYYQNLDSGQRQQLRRLHIVKSCKGHKKNQQKKRQKTQKNIRILINQRTSSKNNNPSQGLQKSKVKVNDDYYWTGLIDYV